MMLNDLPVPVGDSNTPTPPEAEKERLVRTDSETKATTKTGTSVDLFVDGGHERLLHWVWRERKRNGIALGRERHFLGSRFSVDRSKTH